MTIDLLPVFDNEGERVDIDYAFREEDEAFVTPVSVTGFVANRTGILVSHLDGDEDSDEFIVVEDRRLDVDALVNEDVYLSLPYRMLCQPDCKGLCPVCGADLNEGPCSCEKPADPRWDALKDLF